MEISWADLPKTAGWCFWQAVVPTALANGADTSNPPSIQRRMIQIPLGVANDRLCTNPIMTHSASRGDREKLPVGRAVTGEAFPAPVRVGVTMPEVRLPLPLL